MSSSIAELQEKMKENAAKADSFLRQAGFEVHQQNGQRISTKTTSDQQNRHHHQSVENYSREVFMGKIPRELFEDTLVPYMQQAGPLRKIRLMMDFSGTNRGFGFFEYENSEDADYACKYLDKAYLTPDSESPIGIKPSFDNKVLYFGGIPQKVTASDLKRELVRVLGDTIKSIQFPEPTTKPGRQRTSSVDRYAFVTFKTHADATHARRVILPGTVKVCGSKSLTVDWAKPEAKEMKKCERTPPPVSHSAKMVNQTNEPSSSSEMFFFSNNNFNSPFGSRSSSTSGSSTILNFTNPQLHQQQQHLPLAQQSTQPIDTTNLMFNDPFSICDPIDSWSNSQILGDTAKHLLELNTFDNHLTIENINLNKVTMKKLKEIFEFRGHLTVNNLFRSGINSIVVDYAHPSHAQFMLEAIVVHPVSFQRLANPGRVLQAQRGSVLADLNGNY